MKVIVTMCLEIPFEVDDETDLDSRLRAEKLEGCIERYLGLDNMHLCAYIHDLAWRIPHIEETWMWDGEDDR